MLATLLLAALLGTHQMHLAEGQAVVATSDGLWLVTEGAPDPVAPLAAAAAFGVPKLDKPSVTHVTGTDALIVTSRDLSGNGGLWRAIVGAGGAVLVEDLLTASTLVPAPDLVDADYLRGADELFLLDTAAERILVLPDPAHDDGGGLAVWRDLALEQPRSIAADGASVPFRVLVAGRNAVHSYDDDGGMEVLFSGSNSPWHEVDTNPVTGAKLYMATKTDDIGMPVDGGPVSPFLELNAWGFCVHPVQAPIDFVWDALEQGVLVLASEGVDPCLFGAPALGPNHLVRLPFLQTVPPLHLPTLLTPAADSGISGTDGDLALVRAVASEVVFFGEGGVAADGRTPELRNAGGLWAAPRVGKPLLLTVRDAPADAAGVIAFGSELVSLPLWGQTLHPAVQVVGAATSDALGQVDKTLQVPNDAALAGVGVYAQCWFPDTTLPGASGWVGTQAALFVIGP